MKKLILFSSILITCGVLSLGFSFADTWTLLIYMDADNNLHSAGLDDVNEMESVPSNDDVKIIVLFDGYGDGDSVIYDVQHDDDMGNITSPTVDDGGAVIPEDDECSMNNWETLDDFVTWAIAEYPAEHFLLDLWDHGSGIFKDETEPGGLFRGVCWDDHTDFYGYIQIWEVGWVLEGAADTLGYEFAICGWDVCLLGQIETGYEIKDGCAINIASEDNEPGDGWDYTAFEVVTTDPEIAPSELAEAIVDYYLDFYPYSVTQAAVDLVYLDTDLIPSLDYLCELLINYCYVYESEILAARNSADFWNTYNDRDLHQFVEALSDDTDLPEDLREAADDFLTKFETYLIAGGIHNPEDSGDGVTVYFPTNYTSSTYYSDYEDNISFIDTMWNEFLVELEDPSPQTDIQVLAFVANPKDGSLELVWESVDDSEVAGYNLYRRVVSSLEHGSLGESLSPAKVNVSNLSDFERVNDQPIVGESPYTYTDNGLVNGMEYEYLLKAVVVDEEIDLAGTSGVPGGGTVPGAFSLAQNYPNPFSLSTTISFALPDTCDVELSVYDISGRKVATLLSEAMDAGNHSLVWEGAGGDGQKLSSGLYICRLIAGNYHSAVKMVLAR